MSVLKSFAFFRNIMSKPNAMERYGALLGWLTLMMVLLSFVTVVSRNVFNVVWIPVQELALYCHAAALMLGMVYAWRHDKHVRVDVFYQGMSPRHKNILNLLGLLFLAMPMVVFILWVCLPYVADAWSRWEQSPEAGGLPLVWLFKTLLVAMPLTLLGAFVIDVVKGIQVMKQQGGKS